jgi:four helix bundle protein
MSGVKSHKDLVVWQRAMELAVEAYRLSRAFPADERYRLTNQLLRAAASIPANIAEGHARGTRKDYANFIAIARGSLAETETFIQLAAQVELTTQPECEVANKMVDEVGKMLNALLTKLRNVDGLSLATRLF